MSELAVTGLGVVACTGVGREPFARAIGNGNGGDPLVHRATTGSDAPARGGAGDRPALESSPFALARFDIREQLGRKGTTFLDRCTGIALVACAEALADSGIDPASDGARIGVSLGTTTGSLRSMSDYTRETLVEDRPYLVNPGLFPNTVMNCATGQAAIRYGLRGINSTLACGRVAFFGVLHVGSRALRLGHLDATLAGAVEEFSPQRAWQNEVSRADGFGPATGEGASALLLEPADAARARGRHIDAVLEAVVNGFCPGGEPGGGLGDALEARIAQVLRESGTSPSEIAMAACCAPPEAEAPGIGEQAATAVLGAAQPEWIRLERTVGDCGAATAALQTAAILARHRRDPTRDGQRSLLFGWTVEGAVGAAVLRGYSRPEAAA